MKENILTLRLLIFLIPLMILNLIFGSERKLQLQFTIHQEQDVYEQSDYGDPPQFAIWLEDPDTRAVRTVFITYRTGTGEYEGKVECPVSLPIWISAFRTETGRDDFPRPWKPFFDTVTQATPTSKEFSVSIDVEEGKKLYYYIEMNVAGDYNDSFPYVSSDGRPDDHGNGQPSLIYRGEITAEKGNVSQPELIARSHQYYFITESISDLNGIDSAQEVFSYISVECK